MKPAENIEKLIRDKRALDIDTSELADRRILDDILREQEKITKRANVKPYVWRKIMKSRVTKLAFAAVVIIAVVLGINHLGGSIDGTTVALADIVNNMEKMPWVHVITDINFPGQTITKNYWKCFNPSIDISDNSDGSIRYIDYSNSVMYYYEPNTNTITISSKTDEYNLPGPGSPVEIISKVIKAHKNEQDTGIFREQTKVDGLDVEVINIVSKVQNITLVCDIKRKLVISMETQATIPDSGEKVSAYAIFEYPEDGPEDIYALGVPVNAKIIDTRPKGDLKDLTEEIQRRYDSDIGDYIAVVLSSDVREDGTLEPSMVTVMRQKNNLKRVDHYRAFNGARRKDQIASLYEDIKDQWPNISLELILELTKDQEALESQWLFDGKVTFLRDRFFKKVNSRQIQTDLFKVVTDDDACLAGIIWLNPKVLLSTRPSEEKTFEVLPKDRKHAGLWGLRVRTKASGNNYANDEEPSVSTDNYWFAPDKDYMLVEEISHKEVVGKTGYFPYVRRLVKDIAQTSDGKWYPAVIVIETVYVTMNGERENRKEEKHILLNAEPTFEPDIFNPNSLMK